MKILCSLLIVLAIIVVSFGFYRGWFAMSSNREAESNKVDVNLTVDSDKVKEDAESVKEQATEFTDKTTEAAKNFGNWVKDGTKSEKK